MRGDSGEGLGHPESVQSGSTVETSERSYPFLQRTYRQLGIEGNDP